MHPLCEEMHNYILFGRLTHCEALEMCRHTGRLYWQPPRYEMQTCNLSSVPCDAYLWTGFFEVTGSRFFFRAPLHWITSEEPLRFHSNRTDRCNINRGRDKNMRLCMNLETFCHGKKERDTPCFCSVSRVLIETWLGEGLVILPVTSQPAQDICQWINVHIVCSTVCRQ